MEIKEWTYKQARGIADISAEKMAKKLNISLPTLSAYENYKRYPSVQQYMQFCEITGIDNIKWKK